ncbi:MAG: pyridoxal-phosphate dependent enzyme [Desulfurococcaceae archaeon]
MRLRCEACGFVAEGPLRPIVCPRCGGLMRPEGGGRWSGPGEGAGIWRFEGALPSLRVKISLGEGSTPLISSARLAGGLDLKFKDEGRNPTGSFRDRAAALMVSDAASAGARRVILASDGDTAASVAAYSARAGIPVTAYVPAGSDVEKVLMARAYGATVIVREEGIDELADKVGERARREGLYDATSTHNELGLEGMATIAYELALQAPLARRVYVPLGSGLTYLALSIGYELMERSGAIPRAPEIVGVETCGNPLYSSRVSGAKKCAEEAPPTMRYLRPPILEHVLRAMERRGTAMAVRMRDVVQAAKRLAREEGLFVEPASAVALAGFLEEPEDRSVVLLTGQGLKASSAYARPARSRYLEAFPSATKHMIVELLRREPGLTGYEIWKRLGLRISPQAIYQHLSDLARRGVVRAELVGGSKRYYVASGAERPT